MPLSRLRPRHLYPIGNACSFAVGRKNGADQKIAYAATVDSWERWPVYPGFFPIVKETTLTTREACPFLHPDNARPPRFVPDESRGLASFIYPRSMPDKRSSAEL